MKILYIAPEGFDYSSNQITEGLHLLNKRNPTIVEKFVCSNKVVHHGSKIDDLEITKDCSDYVDEVDLILASSGGDLKFKESLFGSLIKSGKYRDKLVFLDGHDSNHYLFDPSLVKLYLKRELRYPEALKMKWTNVRGFTFGVYQFHFDDIQPLYSQRDIDVSFVAFGGSSPLRATCADILSSMKHLKTYIRVDNGKQPISIPEYRSIMRRSKFIVSVPGAGLDTLRFWEAMGFGAVLVSADINKALFIRDCPEHHRQALFFDSWKTMQDLIIEFCPKENFWTGMRLSADELIAIKHSTISRAIQLIDLYKEIR